MKEGGVEIFCNYIKVVIRINNGLLNNLMKATKGLKDRSVSIYKSIKRIKNMRVGVFIDDVEGYPKGKVTI